jgi:DNA primase
MEVWVDFKAVKQAVLMEQVVARYGVPMRKVNAASLRGRCPLPCHGSKDSRESFTVNTAKNVWSCLSASCVAARGGSKGGNALDFTAAMEACTVRDAALKLATWFAVPGSGPGEQQPGRAEAEQGRQEPAPTTVGGQEPQKPVSEKKGDGSSDEPNKPLTFLLHGVDLAHPYLASRGLTGETAAKFGVGFFPGRGSMAGRVVLPIHDQHGQLVAYAGRAVDQAEPRYKFPAGFRKSLELFNYHRAATSGKPAVIVVEGFFDCLKVDQAGFPAVVALMGSSCSKRQEDLLVEKFQRVVLLLDGDDAGRAGAAEIAARIVRRRWVRVIDLPDGKQPDMLSEEELKQLFRL